MLRLLTFEANDFANDSSGAGAQPEVERPYMTGVYPIPDGRLELYSAAGNDP